MSIFCVKKINQPKHIGKILSKARAKKDLSLILLSQETRIPKNYLEALEKENFSILPLSTVHRLAYIKQLAKFYDLNENCLLNQFTIDNGLADIKKIHPHKKEKYSSMMSLNFLVRNLVISGLVLIFLGFLGWQIKGLVKTPELSIYSPQEGQIFYENILKIQGETEKECFININGEEIRPTSAGKFEAEIDLSKGVNTITITATKKHGKTTTITRHVVVKQNLEKLSQI